MTQIIPGESEGIDSMLHRFMSAASRAGIFSAMRKHRQFETPIAKCKRKALAKHKQGKRRFRQ